MTKAEAATLISRAILAEGNQQHILGADAFAQRLATALDALQLLVYAAQPNTLPDNPQLGSLPDPNAPQPQAPGQGALATSSTGERHSLTQQDQPTEWATVRQRV